MGRTKENPSLIFPLDEKTDPGLLDEQIRIQLAKVGITKESDVDAVIAKAEKDYELRRKVDEVKAEIRRLMDIKKGGGKLMQVGYRKWKEVFYPPTSQFKGQSDGQNGD